LGEIGQHKLGRDGKLLNQVVKRREKRRRRGIGGRSAALQGRGESPAKFKIITPLLPP